MISGAAVETNSPAKERTDGETRYRGVALCGGGGDGGETRHRRSPVVKHSQQVLIYSQHLTHETRDPIISLTFLLPNPTNPNAAVAAFTHKTTAMQNHPLHLPLGCTRGCWNVIYLLPWCKY